METYLTADPHFRHANIGRLARRPHEDVHDGDALLVANWRRTVGEDDRVVILGDLAMGSLVESLELVRSLPGRKYLVPGNHDRVSSLYRGSEDKKDQWWRMYRDAGITVLTEVVRALDIGGVEVDLCHFPYEGDSHGEDRYTDARPTDEGRVLLHGHVHDRWQVRGRMINVGVDVWDFTPVPIGVLAELARAAA